MTSTSSANQKLQEPWHQSFQNAEVPAIRHLPPVEMKSIQCAFASKNAYAARAQLPMWPPPLTPRAPMTFISHSTPALPSQISSHFTPTNRHHYFQSQGLSKDHCNCSISAINGKQRVYNKLCLKLDAENQLHSFSMDYNTSNRLQMQQNGECLPIKRPKTADDSLIPHDSPPKEKNANYEGEISYIN